MSAFDLAGVGTEWLLAEAAELTEGIERVKPSEFNEANRYLPESVTSMPGFIRFDVNPFMREIVDCAAVDSPVREVILLKGVQITYSTMLESVALYYMAHVKTLPGMYISADRELADARIENNFLPMLQQSGLGHIIRSSDEGNSRKTGKTKKHIQFEGGGRLVPFGAQNANKMRDVSICWMLQDEVDGWPDVVGKDGDPVKLTADRCSGYWERRKIFRGSTPLLKPSKIEKQFKRGDQRQYLVRCKKCGYPQPLRWETTNKETGLVGGMQWDYTSEGMLDTATVRYCCANCGEAHFEHDKARLFSEAEGAHWCPTATPVQPNVRSYHLPALYSPIGMAPWHKCVADYLDGFDAETKKVIDVKAAQVFYNNILATPWETRGESVRFVSVSAHRRREFMFGQINNEFAGEYCESPVLFLTCTVDVQKSWLSVSVWGWTRGARAFLISYENYEAGEGEPECSEIDSPVWGRLRELIEETVFTADDGKQYMIALTLIDAGYAHDTVLNFCNVYESNVYPILGRDRPAKAQRIDEFAEFKTKAGGLGYRVLVDHYKDRMAPVLRREWHHEQGAQGPYHFNAPLDVTDKQLKELTAERRVEETDSNGHTVYKWKRRGNARNELWDLFGYGLAGVDILAWSICVKHFELEQVDWPRFWDFVEAEQLFFDEG